MLPNFNFKMLQNLKIFFCVLCFVFSFSSLSNQKQCRDAFSKDLFGQPLKPTNLQPAKSSRSKAGKNHLSTNSRPNKKKDIYKPENNKHYSAKNKVPSNTNKNNKDIDKKTEDTNMPVPGKSLSEKNKVLLKEKVFGHLETYITYRTEFSKQSAEMDSIASPPMLKQLTHLANKEKKQLIDLINIYPYLKKKEVRFLEEDYPDSPLWNYLTSTQYESFGAGLGMLHITALLKEVILLESLLKAGVEYRSIRTIKKGYIENNILHIGLKIGSISVVNTVLNNVPIERFGIVTNRFIDEKDPHKQTPWHVSLVRFGKSKNPAFMKVLENHRPSGEVETLYQGRPINGTNLSWHFGEQAILFAKKILVVGKNHGEYVRKKEAYGNRTKPN